MSTVYKLKAHNHPYVFKVVHEVYEEDGYESILFGEYDDGWCIEFEYRRDEKDTIHMMSALHHKTCSIEKNLDRKYGTYVMLKVAICFTFKLFPEATHIAFNDVSEIDCGDNRFTSLAIMKMLTDGQTWYQKHFHAEPAKDRDWDAVVKKLKTKPDLTYDSKYHSLYENSESLQDFFRKVLELYGCGVFRNMSRSFWNVVSDKSIIYSEWKIQRGKNRASYETEVVTGNNSFRGGAKMTRRRVLA